MHLFPLFPPCFLQGRRFSVGDEIICGPDASTPTKSLEPLRCVGETFVIDGDLSPQQASLHFPGEVYTATTMTNFQRRRTSDGDSDCGRNGSASRSFHVVHLRLDGSDSKSAATTHTAASPTQEASSIASIHGDRQLNPIDDKERKIRPASVARGCSKTAEEVGSGTSSGVSSRSSKPLGESSPPHSLSPKHPRSLKNSTSSKREEDCVSMLKAVGRAAMVGFHAHLGGAMRRLTWGLGEFTLIADNIPSACSTLREAFMSGGLYRVTRVLTGGGGQGQHPAEGEKLHASVVADRILKLATQMAAAISHCHCRGVSDCRLEICCKYISRHHRINVVGRDNPEGSPVPPEPPLTQLSKNARRVRAPHVEFELGSGTYLCRNSRSRPYTLRRMDGEA